MVKADLPAAALDLVDGKITQFLLILNCVAEMRRLFPLSFSVRADGIRSFFPRIASRIFPC